MPPRTVSYRLISAVGHETDWTLIDLAADARAPTPTKAAEWAVPKYSELLERLLQNGERQRIAVRRELESARDRLKAAARGLPRRDALFRRAAPAPGSFRAPPGERTRCLYKPQ